MSQLASRSTPVSVGNNARSLNVEPADPDLLFTGTGAKPRKPRTPLSLVVSTPARNRSSLVVILFLVVVAALTVVLVMSISLTKGQYELVDLKSQQADLHKSNQELEQSIASKQSPQELVARAVSLGMVPAGTTGQIDVRSGKVSGSPQPASADTKGLVIIPPASIDKPAADLTVAGSSTGPLSPAAKVQKAAAEQAAIQQAAGQSSTGQKSAGSVPPAAVVPPAPVPVEAAAPELNGGTIPAPAQKDS
ncbi:hypothetical protein [Arthrobacter sp. E3]|uniref:hypothetical protein n=1 Tax=Arthrobacter sp. E3 TaxID=517402 RepID=UPI001A93C5EC|nr:hypothetical protein [Arthrobacter sp. E3]